MRRQIAIDDIFPHAVETLWKTLTSAALIERWLMKPTGFAAVEGTCFTFHTTPGGAWDGIIHCRVLEVVPNRRLVFAWKGGHQSNEGYGAPLDTIVTWTLTPVEAGTRLQLVHSGFVSPNNDTAYQVMSGGWVKVLRNIGVINDEDT